MRMSGYKIYSSPFSDTAIATGTNSNTDILIANAFRPYDRNGQALRISTLPTSPKPLQKILTGIFSLLAVAKNIFSDTPIQPEVINSPRRDILYYNAFTDGSMRLPIQTPSVTRSKAA